MTVRSVAALVAVLLCVGGTGAAPAVPPTGLWKPTFLMVNGSWSAGTAFLLRVDGRPGPLMVTCDHLFGPAAGLREQMTPDDIGRLVCGAVGLSMQDRATIVVTGRPLRVADAHPLDRTGTDKDLALFPVRDGASLKAFELATVSPAVGDTVYVFARQVGQPDPHLLPATVVRSTDANLTYAYADAKVEARGTSGAPVLDADGHVVGMNLGGGTQGDRLLGVANPAAAIRGEIVAATAGNP